MDPVTLAAAKRFARGQGSATAPMRTKHRVLVIEPDGNSYDTLIGAEDAFQAGLLIEVCSWDGFVTNVGQWKTQFDVAYVWDMLMPSSASSTLQQALDALLEFKAGGGLLFVRNVRAGVLRKWTSEGGTSDVLLSSRPALFGLTGSAQPGSGGDFSAGTGQIELTGDNPFQGGILRGGFDVPTTTSALNYPPTAPGVHYPIKFSQDGLEVTVAAYKPGEYFFMQSGGTLGGYDAAAYRYVRQGQVIREMLGNTSTARVALDAMYGRKTASTGIDCDVTTDTAAIEALAEAIGPKRPVGLALVTSAVTPELADFFRTLPGWVTLCSHTHSHFNTRSTVEDEAHVVGPDNRVHLRRPFKPRVTSVRTADTDEALTALPTTTALFDQVTPTAEQYAFAESSGVSGEMLGGVLKLHPSLIGRSLLITYSATENEYRETVGSLDALRETGCITSDAVYLTGYDGSVHPVTALRAARDGVVLADHGMAPAYGRANFYLSGLLEKLPLPVAVLFKRAPHLTVRDTENFIHSKADLKANIIPEAIAYCVEHGLPYHWYDHDFPLVEGNSASLMNTSRWHPDWAQGTWPETVAYAQEFITWWFDRLDEEEVVWLAREDYVRRLEYLNRYLSYDVTATDGGVRITARNAGPETIPGLTFRVDGDVAPQSVTLRGGVAVEHRFDEGVCALWFDLLAGETRVVDVQF